MAASTSDKFSSPTTNDRPSSATTTAIKTNGATSITVDSTSGWETANKVHFTMYEVDANDEKITSTQRDYEGIVNSATSINNVSIRGGADREFPIGAKVICAPTAAWADDLVDGILVHSNQDGTLKDDAVTTDVIADSAVTEAKIADDSVTNAKLDTTAGELGGAWESWTPTLSAGGSMTYTSTSITFAKYIQIGKTVFFRVRVSGTTGGTANTDISFTLPVTRSDSDVTNLGSAYAVDPGVQGAVVFSTGNTQGTVRKYDGSNWGLGTARQINVTGFYEVA